MTTEIADTVNFDEFLVKFSTDSDFQFAHIDFPLTVIWLENEVTGVEKDTTLYLNKKDWQFKDFIDGTKYNVFYKKFRTETGFEIFAAGNQTGVAVTYLFEKRENTWFLVRMEDSSD
ncbi:MAG: DUF4348 domain-containing protein [Prevotellaceae bacterium]|nr:DUF4348 domain-containing protein [Prevotellaceae bacterium]